MTLREFIELYNFRRLYNDKQNTQIIRIYVDLDWFEFGVNDWSYDDSRDKLVEQFLNKKLLDREVISFNFDEENEVFSVYTEIK